MSVQAIALYQVRSLSGFMFQLSIYDLLCWLKEFLWSRDERIEQD